MPLFLLAQSDQETAVFIVGIIFAFLTVAILSSNWRKVNQTKALEESRREIAAYVAEGTISPADAERLISANPKRKASEDNS